MSDYHNGIFFFHNEALCAENLLLPWTTAIWNEEQSFSETFPGIGVFRGILGGKAGKRKMEASE